MLHDTPKWNLLKSRAGRPARPPGSPLPGPPVRPNCIVAGASFLVFRRMSSFAHLVELADDASIEMSGLACRKSKDHTPSASMWFFSLIAPEQGLDVSTCIRALPIQKIGQRILRGLGQGFFKFRI